MVRGKIYAFHMTEFHYQRQKGAVISDSPFLRWSKMLNLELISPVQIAV
jgi:hypothetical protein